MIVLKGETHPDRKNSIYNSYWLILIYYANNDDPIKNYFWSSRGDMKAKQYSILFEGSMFKTFGNVIAKKSLIPGNII